LCLLRFGLRSRAWDRNGERVRKQRRRAQGLWVATSGEERPFPRWFRLLCRLSYVVGKVLMLAHLWLNRQSPPAQTGEERGSFQVPGYGRCKVRIKGQEKRPERCSSPAHALFGYPSVTYSVTGQLLAHSRVLFWVAHPIRNRS
jgi:hypothetical protein